MQRQTQVTIRLSYEEKAEIEERAKTWHLSVSEFMRSRALRALKNPASRYPEHADG